MKKGFKVYYNEETGKFDIDDHETVVVPTTQSDEPNCWFENYDQGATIMNNRNKEIEDGELFVSRCKRCGRMFLMTDMDKEWYIDHNLYKPNRCTKCII